MSPRHALRLLGLLAAAAAASACGGATLIVDGGPPKLDGPLRAVATTSNRPEFSDLIVARLNESGFSALDAKTSAPLAADASGRDAWPGAITLVDSPDARARMKELKVDVLLAIEVKMIAATAGWVSGRMVLDGVKITAYSMTSPGPAGGIDWKNSWGGMPGSPADGTMRQSEPAAAALLAPEIAKLLGAPGPRVAVDAGAAVAEAPVRPKRRRPAKAAIPDPETAAAPVEAAAAPVEAVAAAPAAAVPVAEAPPAPEEIAAEPQRAPQRTLSAAESDAELLP